jgi:predicted PP-loop superfamily ATPase
MDRRGYHQDVGFNCPFIKRRLSQNQTKRVTRFPIQTIVRLD